MVSTAKVPARVPAKTAAKVAAKPTAKRPAAAPVKTARACPNEQGAAAGTGR